MPKLIGNRMAEQLRAFLNREGGRLSATIPPPPHREYPPNNWQHVKITSGPIDLAGSGDDDSTIVYYEGRVERWNAFSEETEVYGDVWVVDLNLMDLDLDSYYTCQQSGNLTLRLENGSGAEDDEDELRPLFVHGELGTLVSLGSGDGDNSFQIRECDPDTGQRYIHTFTFPVSFSHSKVAE